MTLGQKLDKFVQTNFDLTFAAQPSLQTISHLNVMFFNFMSYIIKTYQWSFLQWSLFSLITVTGCFAVCCFCCFCYFSFMVNKITKGSKNTNETTHGQVSALNFIILFYKLYNNLKSSFFLIDSSELINMPL